MTDRWWNNFLVGWFGGILMASATDMATGTAGVSGLAFLGAVFLVVLVIRYIGEYKDAQQRTADWRAKQEAEGHGDPTSPEG